MFQTICLVLPLSNLTMESNIDLFCTILHSACTDAGEGKVTLRTTEGFELDAWNGAGQHLVHLEFTDKVSCREEGMIIAAIGEELRRLGTTLIWD